MEQLTIQGTSPFLFEIKNYKGELIARMNMNGDLTINGNPNEAAQMFWDCLKEKGFGYFSENTRLREALERIDNECSRDDTMAWKIASDALEGLK